MPPKISVIMGVYNCARTLPDAIESIILQTFSDWELIICDDGSTDNTFAVTKEYVLKYSQKIKLIKNPCNLGLNIALNNCLKISQGEFIARQDGDDISEPTRFEKELEAFNLFPEISIVSTPMYYFDENGIWGIGRSKKNPTSDDFLYSTPFCHAASMVRKQAINKISGYTENPKFLRVEDYELWIRMYSRGFIGINLDEPLYRMRDDRNASLRRNFKARINESRVIAKAISVFHMQPYKYIYVILPMIKFLTPLKIYEFFHRKNITKHIN